jgi:SAM-dependent methyltransferase
MDKLIALEAYEALAESYAAVVETKPHNAYYERPATISLLPDVDGLTVLDAGCGPGVYSEWLLSHGAKVVAIDASERMIQLARKRLGDRATIRQADLGSPLSFLDSGTFDVVLSPLVLDYIKDWDRTFAEFYRVMRAKAYFIFSVSHPYFDFNYFKSSNYFETELVECEWRGFNNIRIKMPSYRRPMSALINPLLETGFRLEKIVEPKPTEEFKIADPKHYEELNRFPSFLCIRARKE